VEQDLERAMEVCDRMYCMLEGRVVLAGRPGEVSRDEVVIFEVMTGALDRPWWAAYRRGLERRFRQEKVVARATAFEEL
jgi:energy-coupling factor transporter ATP-binding protein EcfA2